MPVEIRTITSDDVEALKVISRRWFDADSYIDANWRGMDVIVLDGVVIGYADCRENMIDGMMIDFDLHRQGFGSALLSHCERKLFERYEEIILECFEESLQANNFYRKNGWKEERRFLDESNTGMRKILYRKIRQA
jgi:ribosomal protein S18 acetylase RimI-like enzyme